MKTLKGMEYPGRFIIFGLTGPYRTAIYGLTSRNNKARKIIPSTTDQRFRKWKTVETGDNVANSRYLNYNILEARNDIVFLSNGEQSLSLSEQIDELEKKSKMLKKDPQSILLNSFDEPKEIYGIDVHSYEHDKYNTPRISGIMNSKNFALSSIQADKDGKTIRTVSHPYKFEKGEGRGISTYTGSISNPEPYISNPFSIKLKGSLEEVVSNLWNNVLSPETRVSLGGIFWKEDKGVIKEKILP